MKQFLFFLIIFTQFTIKCQDVPTIYATGGMDPNKWDEYVQEVKSSYEEEWAWEEFGLISATCTDPVGAIGASSTLKPQGSNNYHVGNLVDYNYKTAWVEGKSDYGIGEYFIVQSPMISTIYNGYQKSEKSWKNNSRVKKFKVYMNNELICYLKLNDLMGEQEFDLPFDTDRDGDEPLYDSKFKFEIVEIYKGERWNDVAITHVGGPKGCCLVAESFILNEVGVKEKISQVNQGDKIKSVNFISNKTHSNKVKKVVSQMHDMVLEISTKHNTIKATSDHPFYIRNYGFMSLKDVLKMNKMNMYTSLINNVEVLVWDEVKNKTVFEKISNIKILHGSFETYTILDLESGNNFIANGFITSTY